MYVRHVTSYSVCITTFVSSRRSGRVSETNMSTLAPISTSIYGHAWARHSSIDKPNHGDVEE